MRSAFILLLTATQAQAWTFTPGLICRLSHEIPTAQVELTYDPAGPLYSVTVTTDAPLPNAPIFSVRFIGPQGNTISTNRHSLGPDGRSVTVMDRGFGNVLNGLQFNETAQVTLGDTTLTFPLEGAAGPTAQFRACEVAAGA